MNESYQGTNSDQNKDQNESPNPPHMTAIITQSSLTPPSIETSHSPTTSGPLGTIPLLTITTSPDSRSNSPSPIDINKNKQIKNIAYRECSNCYTSDSPIWRKGPNDDKLCNKCGLYWSRHNKHRPIQIARTRSKKPEGVGKKVNSPRVNSPRANSPRANSPRISSPRVSSPLTRVNSPLIAAAQQIENAKFAFEDDSGHLMLLLEAVQQSNDEKEDSSMDDRNDDQGSKQRKMLDVNGSAFKAVVRELAVDQGDMIKQNGASNTKQPKMVSLVNRVLLM